MEFALYTDPAATNLFLIVQAYTASNLMRNFSFGHKRNITIGTTTSEIFRGNGTGDVSIAGSSGTNWIVPDPDDEIVDHFLYTISGTRFNYRHRILSGTTARFNMHTPSLFDGTDYITPFTDENYDLLIVDYDRTQFRPELIWIYGDYDGRDYSFYERIWRGKALLPAILLRDIHTGTLSDPRKDGAMSVNYIDISAYGTQPFKPTKNTRRGGTGTGTYHGAVNGERPNIATRNSTTTFGGSGDGLTYYQLGSMNGLHRCINYVYEMGVLRDNQYLRDAMVSAYILPVLTITSTAASGVRIADNTINDFDPLMSIQIFDQAHISDMKSCYYDFGELDGWGDKLDFTHTQLTLFLPFVGSVNIDINACMYNRLEVDYCIDVYNGNIIYYVYTNSLETDTDTLYGTYTGNCAIDIPLCGAGQSGSVLGRITNAVSSLAVGAASIAAGNPVTTAGAALGMIDAATPTYKVDRSGAIDVNGACLSPYRISLKISQPVELRADTQLNVGRASFFDCAFSDLPAGKHIISAVEVDGISTATAAEQEQIKQILMRGVYVK